MNIESLWSAINSGNVRAVANHLSPGLAATAPVCSRAEQEESSPTDDAGTAGVVSSEASMSSFRQFVAETFLPAFAPKPQDVRAKVELHLGKPIVTTHVFPPIPCRTFDWCAYPDGEEEDGNYGWGKTEAEALAELIQSLQLDERIPETL